MNRNLGILQGFLGAMILAGWGCATEMPPLVDPTQVTGSLVVGRVVTVLTGETSRRYPPTVRFFELEDETSRKRFQVEVRSHDQYFAVDLQPGTYRVNRVQISEGPFMSMADLGSTFIVDPDAIIYVGTWRFGVDSPRYGRNIVTSIIADQEETARVRDFLNDQYPGLDESSMVANLPQPTHVEARLYEVMPYPRYPRYFRRHWW